MDQRLTLHHGLPYQEQDAADHRFNNVYLSLVVERGSFFVNPAFGSRLHLLRRAKCTAATEAAVVDYCTEALQWLITAGRARAVAVQTERDLQTLGRINFTVTVTWADNVVTTYTSFVGVV